ncbi:MAG: response regulator transcription factor [Rubripirellula sp.]
MSTLSVSEPSQNNLSPCPYVYLIEDDVQVLDSLGWMLSGLDIETRSFGKPSELLKLDPPSGVGCLVVDLRLPEMSGIELIEKARELGWEQPFIVITGFGRVPDAVSAMRRGAVDFLQKPLSTESFVASVRRAIARDTVRHERSEKKRLITDRMNRLTPRESQVLELVITGKLNKQIAEELSVSVKTVEAHRSNLTRKLDVDSVAQLVRFVLEARA